MDPNWLTGIGTITLAVATFVLAGITFWSIRKANEANKLLREETKRIQEKEKIRLGRLQALDIISNWANELNDIVGDKMFRMDAAGPLNKFLYRNDSTMDDREAVRSAGELFDTDFKVHVLNTLDAYNKLLQLVVELRNTIDQESQAELNESQQKIIEARIFLLNKIAELRTFVRKHRITFLL